MKTSIKDPFANAITNIDLINNFVAASKNDQIIRATDITSGKSPRRNIQLYCRNGKFEQLWQKLTDWTMGAKTKQTLAKNAIIYNLNIIKKDPDFLAKFTDQDKKNEILNSINKIIMTVESAEKDITSSMIQSDLQFLNNYLKTSAGHQKKSELFIPLADSSEGDVANSEAESDLNAAKGNNAVSNITELVGLDIDDGVTIVMHPSEVDNFENNIKANISKNMSSYISKLANVTSIDVAEVVFNSEDPEVDGRPYKEPNSQPAERTINNSMHALKSVPPDGTEKLSNSSTNAVENPDIQLMRETLEVVNYSVKPAEETNSSLAESAPTINTTLAPIGEAIEQDMDAAEAAAERDFFSALSLKTNLRMSGSDPTLSPSTTESKVSEATNPHLASLKSEWNPADSGYLQITELFSITSGIATSSMIADTYLVPSDVNLRFQGSTIINGTTSSGVNFVKGDHNHPSKAFDKKLINDNRESNYDAKRSYLQFSASRPARRINPANLTKAQEKNFKEELGGIYKTSIDDIIKEHKNNNNGGDPKSLVIVPFFQDLARVSQAEVDSLVDAVIRAQASNPKLNINISTVRDEHKELIKTAYEMKVRNTSNLAPPLQSIRTDLLMTDQGYYEVSKPLHITGGLEVSKFLAQAYLLSVSKNLTFSGGGEGSSESNPVGDVKSRDVFLPDLININAKPLAHSYLQLVAEAPNISQAAGFQGLVDFRINLFQTYMDSVNNVVAKYKQFNPGKELTSLVISPITVSPGALSEVEITALVSALKYIEYENPDLNIVIAADEQQHADRIQAAYER